MGFRIDEKACVGCGICADVCPDGIEIVGAKAKILSEDAACMRYAIEACPRSAILSYEGHEGQEKNTGDAGTSRPMGNQRGNGRGVGSGRGHGVGMGRAMGRVRGRSRRGW